MTKLKLISKGLLGASAITLLSATTAYAGGTSAGTSVSNTFTLDYKVGAVDQPTIDTSGSPTLFTVDRLVNLTVASAGDTTVAPGAQDQRLVFSVTNTGNDVQAYDLLPVQEGADDFNAENLIILTYADSNGNGICESIELSGAGTPYTLGAASVDVLADATLCVVIEGDINSLPLPAAPIGDADESIISLVADTLESLSAPAPGTVAGDEVVADSDGLNALTGNAENVLADGSGTTVAGTDLVNQGDHSATGTYIVASADLEATKAVTIFSEDGAGCATIPGTPAVGNQYSIPGACVEYVISVSNVGITAAATDINIQDILPANLEFVSAVVDTAKLTGGSFSQPTAGVLCDGTGIGANACIVSLTGASLAAGAVGVPNVGTVTIRALIIN